MSLNVVNLLAAVGLQPGRQHVCGRRKERDGGEAWLAASSLCEPGKSHLV